MTAQSTTVTAADLQVRVLRQGDGPALLFAHCLGGDLSAWSAQTGHFADRYTTVAYDLRGQGGTQVTPGPYRIDQLAEDALALLDALGIERAVFLGVSMGGMVALATALRAPERIAGLVIADSAAGFSPEARAAWDQRIAAVRAEGIAPMVDTMLGRWFTDDFRQHAPATVAAVGEVLQRAPVDGYLASCAAIRELDLVASLPRIACPTLVLCGENDPSTPLSLSEDIAAGIPGARLAVLAGARHLTQLEFADHFNAHVEAFLADIAYA